jgi:hypothetical protein
MSMRRLMMACVALVVCSGYERKQHDVQVAPKPEQSAVKQAAQPKQQSLAQVLSAAGLRLPEEPVSDLNHAITSYAVLNDRDAYLIAYYWNLPSGTLEDPLRVLSFNRQTGEWKNVQLMLGGGRISHAECVGSVLQAHALQNVFLLDTHINPSAGCLIILERNLAFRNALYGWYLAAASDGQIVFQRSEVHFTTVHPAELALYDLKTNRETPLFPRKPFGSVRSEYIAKLRDFYRTQDEWCKENNDPCDPENVDSALYGEVAVNESEHALAFVISYENIQQFLGPVRKPDGPGKVVYVYRHVNDEAKLDYREMLFSDAERHFSKPSLRSLLEPAALHEIFAASPNHGNANED